MKRKTRKATILFRQKLFKAIKSFDRELQYKIILFMLKTKLGLITDLLTEQYRLKL